MLLSISIVLVTLPLADHVFVTRHRFATSRIASTTSLPCPERPEGCGPLS